MYVQQQQQPRQQQSLEGEYMLLLAGTGKVGVCCSKEPRSECRLEEHTTFSSPSFRFHSFIVMHARTASRKPFDTDYRLNDGFIPPQHISFSFFSFSFFFFFFFFCAEALASCCCCCCCCCSSRRMTSRALRSIIYSLVRATCDPPTFLLSSFFFYLEKKGAPLSPALYTYLITGSSLKEKKK